jgi:hypothetical protein
MAEDTEDTPQVWEIPNLSTEELHHLVHTIRHRTFWWERREKAAWDERVRRGEDPDLFPRSGQEMATN